MATFFVDTRLGTIKTADPTDVLDLSRQHPGDPITVRFVTGEVDADQEEE